LIWIVDEDEKLSENAKKTYLDNSNDIYLSAASLWEMAIKMSQRKLALPGTLSGFVEKHVLGNNIQILSVIPDHVFPLVKLPYHHRDPFDRLLICQCVREHLPIISNDIIFDAYKIQRIW
jgi:PIN domain nuclease of toxin-antitoxin system